MLKYSRCGLTSYVKIGQDETLTSQFRDLIEGIYRIDSVAIFKV